MTLDLRTKAQIRADRWKDLYQALRTDNPEASDWKICEAIAKQTNYTAMAVLQRLKANGIITK